MNEAKIRYEEYLKSDNWADLREKVLNERGQYCAACRSGLNLHCHHLNYKKLYDCEVKDILVLCENCHNSLHRVSNHSDFYNLSSEESEIKVLHILKNLSNKKNSLKREKVKRVLKTKAQKYKEKKLRKQERKRQQQLKKEAKEMNNLKNNRPFSNPKTINRLKLRDQMCDLMRRFPNHKRY